MKRNPLLVTLFLVALSLASFYAGDAIAWPWSSGPGTPGVPNTLQYVTWKMPAGVTTAYIDDASGNHLATVTDDGTTGHVDASYFEGNLDAAVSIRQQGTTKQSISFYSGDGAGANADRLDVNSDGITAQGGATAIAGFVSMTAPAGNHLSLHGGSGGATRLYAGDGTLEFSTGATTGSANFPDGVSIGSGSSTMIDKRICGSASLNFGSTSANGRSSLSFTVTGMIAGMPISVGRDGDGTMGSGNVNWECSVQSANSVLCHFLNGTAASLDPSPITFTACQDQF